MLKRETFVDAISKIKKHEELMDRLDSVCREFGSFRPSPGFGNLHLQALLDVLREVMNDKHDYISWWLFEGTDQTVSWEQDGQWVTVELKDAGALYDYLVEYNKVKKT